MLKIKLGLWLWSLGLKIAARGRGIAMGNVPEGTGLVFDGGSPDSVTIHRVIEGPFTQDDLQDEWTGPEDADCYLVVLLEVDGATEEVEWYFFTMDEAYEMVKHFKSSIEPIVITGGT